MTPPKRNPPDPESRPKPPAPRTYAAPRIVLAGRLTPTLQLGSPPPPPP